MVLQTSVVKVHSLISAIELTGAKTFTTIPCEGQSIAENINC